MISRIPSSFPLVLVASALSAADVVDLSGVWRFALDPQDAGIAGSWQTTALPGTVQLPGSLQQQGLGLPVTVDTPWTANVQDRSFWTSPIHERDRRAGDIRMPCWLTPTNHYVGAAWYQRTVTIPDTWRGRRVTARFERVHWSSRLWLDGVEVPSLGQTQESLSVPHVYDLGTQVAAGIRTLTLRIDNRMLVDVGNWAHSVSDHTQGNWNGVIGDLRLEATAPVLLGDVQAYPDRASRTVKVTATLRHDPGDRGTGQLTIAGTTVPVTWPTETPVTVVAPLPTDAADWDEYQPRLTTLPVRLSSADGRAEDQRDLRIGLRDLTVSPERDFILNGRPILLRGTLECAIFPETGHPPTDEAAWERIYRICREHGLNHLRFHSWCPPKAAFAAADRLGFYLQVEAAAWTGVGKGQPQDAWLYREAGRIFAEYGNHPSFLLFAYGNEPLPYSHDADRDRWLSVWVDHWKAHDPRRFHTSAGFYPQLPENQFHITLADRGPSRWPDALLRTDPRVPVLVHEMGQYVVYPDFDEIARYTGHLKARNFEIFRDSAAANGVLPLARDFLQASGRLQVLCYQEDIESALRTPGIAGFQLLDLHDFPGQGTALVGVLNAFWEPKGYVTAAEYRRFAGATVPLARLPRTAEARGRLRVPVGIAHYGPAALPATALTWTLTNAQGQTVVKGSLPAVPVPLGRTRDLGAFDLDLDALPAPARYRLEVAVPGTEAVNGWEVALFPPADAPEPATPGVTLVTALVPGLAERAAAGETLVIAHPWLGQGQPPGSFTPVFWNRQWFGSQATRTLGLLIDPAHPALAAFPTDRHTTWAWKDILDGSRCLSLAEGDLVPVVRWIDDFNTNRPLALVAEARIGAGRVLLCAADLAKDLDRRPGARQLRRSLLAYAASSQFRPTATLSTARLAALTTQPAAMRLGVVAEASSAHGRHPGSAAVDGDAATFWHTPWENGAPGYPHELTLRLPEPARLTGVVLTPRQDIPNGRPRSVTVLTSTDTSTWRPVARVDLPEGTALQPIAFPAELVSGVRLVFDAPQRPQDRFVSLAEVEVVEDR